MGAAALHGQTYWTTDPSVDCSGIGTGNSVSVYNGSTLLGYSCAMTGTFIWLAAGGGWSTAIRVAGPATGAVGVDYLYYDTNGNPMNLDTTAGVGGALSSGNELSFALDANQPAETDMLGATSNAGQHYNNIAVGSVYATFLCPDSVTCSDVLPQLLYSNLPGEPWSLSAPIAWDDNGGIWTGWSAEGIDNGSSNRVSFVVYNQDTTPTAFTIQVFDKNGNLFSSGTTPVIQGFQQLSGGGLGEAETFGDLLSNYVHLPSGTFKVLFDGGGTSFSVEVLQFTGPSATTLQVAYEDASSAGAAVKARRSGLTPSVKGAQAKTHVMHVFKPFPKS